jgi:transcriptional regulator with XRE-family HTH domain
MTPRQFLGKELCRARVAAGFSSQQVLADHLGFERTVIAKAESGDRVPSDPVLTAWAEACNLDTEHYQRLADLARASDGPVPVWFEGYLEAEREALTLRIWQPIIIPGLLQTADYARALFLAAQNDTSDEAIDALVAARLERQAIFDKPSPPDVLTVLDELVLHRLIGSPQVMYDQLTHLAELSARPYVSVQVVPADNGANAGLGGALNLASGDGTPDVLYMDAVEGQTAEKRSLVRQAGVAFERVRGNALSRGQSRDLVLRLADELWKQ